MATNKTNETNETNDSARSITPTMIAEELNVSPKALRSFIRSQLVTNRAGKGGAWRFTADEAAMIKDRYMNRAASRATAPVFKDDSAN